MSRLALAAVLSMACAGQLQAQTPARPVAVVVEVPVPPGVDRATIDGQLRAAVPQYRAVPGLRHKLFTVADAGGFGGVYAFESRAAAQAWFSPAWHARVLKTYGRPGVVRYYDVVAEVDGPAAAAR